MPPNCISKCSVLPVVGGDADSLIDADTQAMYALLEKYTHEFPTHTAAENVAQGLPVKESIVITGCAGALIMMSKFGSIRFWYKLYRTRTWPAGKAAETEPSWTEL